MRQLFLGHGKKNIALVFFPVDPFFKKVAAGIFIPVDLRVVTRHHIPAAQFFGAQKQFIEFQISVTIDTGIGRRTAFIGADKLVDDTFFETVGKVKYIMVHR